jgi:hypothetical protein
MIVLRSYKDNQPLTLANIRANVPAVFADKKYFKMSDKYTFIPTSTVLEALMDNGFQPYEARQAGAREQGKAPFTRHMLRFRHKDVGTITDFDTVSPEIVLYNGHDGSAKYSLFAALFRLVCLNGMMAGHQYGGMTIRHSGNVAEEALKGSFKIVNDEMPALVGSISNLRGTLLSPELQLDFARKALALRYRGNYTTLPAENLLTIRRSQDENNDVWSILNRIQENVTSIDHSVRSVTGRVSHVREVKAVNETIRINRGLWDLASQYAAGVPA